MKAWFVSVLLSIALLGAHAQRISVDPQVRTSAIADHQITILDLVPHFVTTIRVPEPVNAVVIGDAALFQVEHSEREPELVFVKALREERGESNLLISTARGRQISFLLVNHSQQEGASKADFLFRYRPPVRFLVEPDVSPFALVSQTTTLPFQDRGTTPQADSIDVLSFGHSPKQESLDALLERQKRAPLPKLYGGRIESDDSRGDRLRAGIGYVFDGSQGVVVLFSVINTSKKPILLMAPQVQLGGKEKSGRLIRHKRWSTAEQLAVIDFRLSRRRLTQGERADGVVQFERPPYKQSTEKLFLQMAESGAVDKPALAPIGIGATAAEEASSYEQ